MAFGKPSQKNETEQPDNDAVSEFLEDDAFAALVTKLIMTNRAYFSRFDWIRTFERQCEREDRGDLLSKKSSLFNSQKFVRIAGKDDFNGTFSTQEMLNIESEMMELAGETTDFHNIPQHLVEATFDKYPTMADEQKEVVKAACTGNRRVVVTEGTAGAGKSFSLNAIREIYENVPPSGSDSKGYHIVGTALSWTATKVLEASAGLRGGRAIEGLLREMEKAEAEGKSYFPKRTLLIVDEAGLVGTDHMHKLLKLTSRSKVPVRVILTGDSLQLNPVMRGNSLELIVFKYGSSRLDTIRRQKQASHRAAVKHFCYGRAENGLWIYEHQEAIFVLDDKEAVFRKIIDDYISYRVSFPEKKALVLALKNDDVDRLNREIRKEWLELGFLGGEGVVIFAGDGKDNKDIEFRVGDRIVLRKNAPKHPVFKKNEAILEGQAPEVPEPPKEPAKKKGWFSSLFSSDEPIVKETVTKELPIPERFGIFNRSGGTIKGFGKNPAGKPTLLITLDEGGEIVLDSGEYLDKDTGAFPVMHNFATTIYASQGQTVERVFMADSPLMNRRLAYVGMSRHTELCDIYVDKTELSRRKLRGIDPVPDPDNVSRDELLARMAFSWNAPSDNRTAHIVIEEEGKSGSNVTLRRLHPFEGDKADDHHTFHPVPGRMHKGEPPPIPLDAPVRGRVFDGKPILGDDEGITDKILADTNGVIWTSGRHGDVRIIAMGYDGHPSSRYSLDGEQMVGDGDIPFWRNASGNENTPVLIVQTPREAIIAWSYYRKTRSDKPETIPHIALYFGDVRLETLFDHLDKERIIVSHAKSRPESLEGAQKIAEMIEKTGKSVDILPKIKNDRKPAP